MNSSDHERELAQWTAQQIKEIILAEKIGAEKILDVGCGNGLITYYLQEILWESSVTGIDRNIACIKNAVEEFPEISFLQSDDKIPLNEANFDCVFAAYVFHHLNRDEQKKLVQEMMRVIKPNGVMIILEFNPWHIPTLLHFLRNPEERGAHMISMNNLKKMLAKFGNFRAFYNSDSHTLISPVYTVLLNRSHS